MISSIIQRYFGQDSLDWYHRSYLIDWYDFSWNLENAWPLSDVICRSLVGFLWFLSYMISSFLPLFERDFSLTDELISHPHKPNQ